MEPLKVTLEECVHLIDEAAGAAPVQAVMAEWGTIQVINGRYGPYIKADGANYRIPKGTDATALTEADCRRIIAESAPTSRPRRGTKK